MDDDEGPRNFDFFCSGKYTETPETPPDFRMGIFPYHQMRLSGVSMVSMVSNQSIGSLGCWGFILWIWWWEDFHICWDFGPFKKPLDQTGFFLYGSWDFLMGFFAAFYGDMLDLKYIDIDMRYNQQSQTYPVNICVLFFSGCHIYLGPLVGGGGWYSGNAIKPPFRCWGLSQSIVRIPFLTNKPIFQWNGWWVFTLALSCWYCC